MSKDNRLRLVQELVEKSIRAIPEVESVTAHLKRALIEIADQQKKKAQNKKEPTYAERWNKDLRDGIKTSIINPMSVSEAKKAIAAIDMLIKVEEDRLKSLKKVEEPDSDVFND